MKKPFRALFVAFLTLFTLTSCGEIEFVAVEPSEYKNAENNYYVEMVVANHGTMYIELFTDLAPITVANFVSLIEEEFYDGLTFHRVISGFVIQGGDPDGDGTGGSDNSIKGEFTNNKVNNHLTHKRGVISMARLSDDKNSATSQFFIMHATTTSLDGDYAAFGQLYNIESYNTLDSIAGVSVNSTTSKPTSKVTIETVRLISKDS